NEDGSIVAVVNGEIYDHERLRAELVAAGHRFRTGSDSEVLVHLYAEHGPSCVARLRGEIAFVLWDARNQLLLAGRDRFGIKPLHWAEHDGTLVLGSEAKALFAAGVPARWDQDTFHTSTIVGGPVEDRSFFAGVRQVPPGHTLVATRSGVRLVRYWDFDYPEQPDPAPEPELLEQLDAELTEAVRLRLRADVQVACYLSGGIDSATALGKAAKLSSKPITAFTLKFDRPEYDESVIAREMAAHAGADYVEVPVGEADFTRDFADAVWHAERPLNNANSSAKFRLSRAVREAGIKVVLTGEGADEVFAGYPHYRRDLFLWQTRNDPERAAASLAALERSNAVSRGILMPEGEGLSLAAALRATGAKPTWLAAFSTSGHKMRGLWSDAFARSVGDRDPLAPFVAGLEVARQLHGRHPVHQSMYLWSKSVLPNYILSVLGDRMEMAHSVEGRLPFLDHKVVELAAKLPIDLLIRGEVEKYALREVARPVVTETIYRRQKHPFFAPPVTDGPLGELLHDTLRGAAFADVPFFDRRKVVGLLDSLGTLEPATRVAMDAPLLLLLSTALMQQRFSLAS
ncbi:MAG: asparagine synthase (glutamine-hydrolyzing), partial [Deltaproteobacteria bacterium]|nr:asparagine synthase (glutamine-hydrolyzing) [Nannocystaceae bacterium]